MSLGRLPQAISTQGLPHGRLPQAMSTQGMPHGRLPLPVSKKPEYAAWTLATFHLIVTLAFKEAFLDPSCREEMLKPK